MFDAKSRYAKLATTIVTDHRGRQVEVVPVPPAPKQATLGTHLLREGQRVDHLAHQYLDNPAGFWRIAELNGAMLPEVLTEQREISIPTRQS
jgi:hypothetical protein